MRFLCSNTFRDIGRKKCNFCLAFCSVFVVVLSTLVINTVIDLGPIIFLKMGEQSVGQFDAIITPNEFTVGDFGQFENSDANRFLNFSKAMEQAGNYNLAPRKQWCGSTIRKNLRSEETCLMLMDT